MFQLKSSSSQQPQIYKMYFDGGAQPNPGKSASSAILYDDIDNTIQFKIARYTKHSTNNQAEYNGVIIGLKKCIELGIKNISIFGDSLLVVNQLSNKWKIYNIVLKDLHNTIHELLLEFDNVWISHIPRKLNSAADELCNLAIHNKTDIIV